VILQAWLEQLRAAKTEQEVVAFARSHLERVKATGHVPEPLEGRAVDDGNDVRAIASTLARAPSTRGDPRVEADLFQQMLILFSLATDRLSQLTAQGAIAHTPQRFIPLR
jgi:hypothetical protein